MISEMPTPCLRMSSATKLFPSSSLPARSGAIGRSRSHPWRYRFLQPPWPVPPAVLFFHNGTRRASSRHRRSAHSRPPWQHRQVRRRADQSRRPWPARERKPCPRATEGGGGEEGFLRPPPAPHPGSRPHPTRASSRAEFIVFPASDRRHGQPVHRSWRRARRWREGTVTPRVACASVFMAQGAKRAEPASVSTILLQRMRPPPTPTTLIQQGAVRPI